MGVWGSAIFVFLGTLFGLRFGKFLSFLAFFCVIFVNICFGFVHFLFHFWQLCISVFVISASFLALVHLSFCNFYFMFGTCAFQFCHLSLSFLGLVRFSFVNFLSSDQFGRVSESHANFNYLCQHMAFLISFFSGGYIS